MTLTSIADQCMAHSHIKVLRHFCRFSCLLEYVQQPLAKAPAGLNEVLSQVPCPRHIFQMDLNTAEQESSALPGIAASCPARASLQQSLTAGQPLTAMPRVPDDSTQATATQLYELGQVNRPVGEAASGGQNLPIVAQQVTNLVGQNMVAPGPKAPVNSSHAVMRTGNRTPFKDCC